MAEDSVNPDVLKPRFDALMRLQDEIDDLNAQKAQVYKDCKDDGLDPKFIRKAVSIARKDPSDRDEEETMLSVYLAALGLAR